MKASDASSRIAVTVFPLIILIAGAVGTLLPAVAMPLNAYVPVLLGIVMFGMGLTLTAPDLRVIVRQPQAVLIGCVAQYVIMPGAAWAIGTLLHLSPQLLVGLVLLGAAPGGTSSNIVAYLARGNVALSVAMTTVSTLLSPILTPLIIWLLAGRYVPVDALAMMKQIVMIVIIPVVLGLLVRMIGRSRIQPMIPVVPWLSVAVLAFVIAGIMAKSADVVLNAALPAIAAVILHNAVGFALGLGAGLVGRLGPAERRAVAVEVGMQNAGLAAALAVANYSPTASVPAAIATVWHNVAGAVFAWLIARDRNAAATVENMGTGFSGS